MSIAQHHASENSPHMEILHRFLTALETRAMRTCGHGECARHLREALDAAGIDTRGHPERPKDWGPMLARVGFAAMTPHGYEPRRGDIVVFQPVPGAPDGHVQAYTGSRWISDVVQPTGFWPAPAYRTASSRFMPYRHE